MTFRGFITCLYDLFFTRYEEPDLPEITYYPDGERI